jgi:hypothetical protein
MVISNNSDLDNLINTGVLPYYEFKGEVAYNDVEIRQLLNKKNFNPIIKIANNIISLLSKIIPLFYATTTLSQLPTKGILGV